MHPKHSQRPTGESFNGSQIWRVLVFQRNPGYVGAWCGGLLSYERHRIRLERCSLGNRCHLVMLLPHASDWRLAIMWSSMTPKDTFLCGKILFDFLHSKCVNSYTWIKKHINDGQKLKKCRENVKSGNPSMWHSSDSCQQNEKFPTGESMWLAEHATPW